MRRKVALKVIKPGMDTKQVIARFEAERQALALRDQPNIARVLDAGATAGGRPFFVLELVRGEPIDAHCDRNRLSHDERLELFGHVCSAVQHAHTKGIIHRDLKPGMDSGQIIARFEAERQALAMMDHLNIARVFDAGATDDGRPYFAMEHVRGEPITDYCDRNRLSTVERLDSSCRSAKGAASLLTSYPG